MEKRTVWLWWFCSLPQSSCGEMVLQENSASIQQAYSLWATEWPNNTHTWVTFAVQLLKKQENITVEWNWWFKNGVHPTTYVGMPEERYWSWVQFSEALQFAAKLPAALQTYILSEKCSVSLLNMYHNMKNPWDIIVKEMQLFLPLRLVQHSPATLAHCINRINSNIIHDVNILFQERRALCLRMPVVAGFQTEPFTIFML